MTTTTDHGRPDNTPTYVGPATVLEDCGGHESCCYCGDTVCDDGCHTQGVVCVASEEWHCAGHQSACIECRNEYRAEAGCVL